MVRKSILSIHKRLIINSCLSLVYYYKLLEILKSFKQKQYVVVCFGIEPLYMGVRKDSRYTRNKCFICEKRCFGRTCRACFTSRRSRGQLSKINQRKKKKLRELLNAT